MTRTFPSRDMSVYRVGDGPISITWKRTFSHGNPVMVVVLTAFPSGRMYLTFQRGKHTRVMETNIRKVLSELGNSSLENAVKVKAILRVTIDLDQNNYHMARELAEYISQFVIFA